MEAPAARRKTEEHLLARTHETLEEARQRKYFMFKCRIDTNYASMPLMLMFAKGGDVFFERQVGWAKFYRDAGGNPDADAAEYFREVVEREILASDGIEPWGKGSVRRA
jgi:hypothetical protein